MSPTHYRGSTGDVFYLIPFKKIPIPGIPIDVAAVNLLFFVIGIYLIITCDIPVFYVKYCRKRENIIWVKQITPKTTNSNSLLPNTASNDIQQHVNSANSGDVDICNLTVTLIRTVVLQRSWYQLDARVFSSMKNEQKYPWLYDSGTPRVFM